LSALWKAAFSLADVAEIPVRHPGDGLISALSWDSTGAPSVWPRVRRRGSPDLAGL